MSGLWDIQVLVYVGMTTAVVVMALVVLAVVTRRVRCLTSDVESMRRDVKLLEEGMRTVSDRLQAGGAAALKPEAQAVSDGEGA